MSDFFVIVTLSILMAAWTVIVLRRPGGRGLLADPIEAIQATWLRVPVFGRTERLAPSPRVAARGDAPAGRPIPSSRTAGA